MKLLHWLAVSLSVSFGFCVASATGHQSGAEARMVAASAAQALARVPASLRPDRLVLELEPRLSGGEPKVEGVEYHRSGALLIGAGSESVGLEQWLHEIAHVRLAGTRPSGKLARRLIDAVEEGVADYFAASVANTPLLGEAPRQRNLREPPAIGASEWASLAFDGFDTHRMGWVLAAELYRLDPSAGELLEDSVACLDHESALQSVDDSPAAAISALLSACPERSRARLSRAFRNWLPPQLCPSDPT
jgi:hypothetical protein